MELKKTAEANNEKQKSPILLMGYMFVMSLILASFAYIAPVEDKSGNDGTFRANNNETEDVVKEDEPEPEPEEPETVELQQVEATEDDTAPQENVTTPPVTTPPVTPPKPPAPKPPAVEDKVIEFPDVEASFPGGFSAMQTFIQTNIQYPELSMDMGEQGKVYVSFVVDKDGQISNVKIERGVSELLDKEAKRIVRSMPTWVAGEKSGEKVKTKVSLPIVFRIG